LLLADSLSLDERQKRLLRAIGWLGFLFWAVGVLGASDPNPKVGAAPKTEWLVEITWLHENLKNSDLILVDTRSQKEYTEGHIPGAIWLDLSDLPTRTSDHGLQELKQQLSQKMSLLGIRGTEKVVFYEEHTGTRAPRALWFLAYAGYLNGKVLHGGISAWRGANYAMSWQPTVRPPQPFQVRENPEVLASADYVLRRIKNPGCVILDVRSQEEYSGLDPKQNSRSGHIPGAAWLEWKELLDGTMNYKSLAELEERLFDAGISPDKEVITYCQVGSRSANTYLALRILGYPRLKNYIGSWQEWSSRLDLPVEKPEASSTP
jgi:thiosulfate/3-mercaptopyruvate sulfurtransferase